MRQVLLTAANSRDDLVATTARDIVSKYVELMARTDEGHSPISESKWMDFPGDVHGLWLLNAEARYFCIILKDYDSCTSRICSIPSAVTKKFSSGITPNEPESTSLLPALILDLARIRCEADDLVSARFRSTQLAGFIKDLSRTFSLTLFPLEVSSQSCEIAAWCRRTFFWLAFHIGLRNNQFFSTSNRRIFPSYLPPMPQRALTAEMPLEGKPNESLATRLRHLACEN
jgi:hypothetical protein